VLVVSKDFVRGSRIAHRKVGAMPGDVIELIGQTAPGSLATEASEAVAEGSGHGGCLGLAGQFGQRGG
jgi:hypothetical protein